MKNITNVFCEFLIALCCLMSSSALWAWEDMSTVSYTHLTLPTKA